MLLSLVTHLITSSCQVQLLGHITKNLKLYSIPRKSNQIPPFDSEGHMQSNSNMPIQVHFLSILSSQWCLLGFLILRWYYLCWVCISWNMLLLQIQVLFSFSINLSCHPIQSLLHLQQHLFIPIYYSFIHVFTTTPQIFIEYLLWYRLSFPKHEFLLHVQSYPSNYTEIVF